MIAARPDGYLDISINNPQKNYPEVKKFKDLSKSFMIIEEAILETLLKRPSKPMINSIEDVIEARMTRLTMSEVQDHDQTIVKDVSN